MSIVNFEERLKTSDTVYNTILNNLNRIHDAKLSGVLEENEYAKELVLTGNLFANKIKQGKVTEEEIEQVEAYVSGLDQHYFSFKHSDLDKASKIVLEGNYMALQTSNVRSASAQPVLKESDYNRTFRKLR